MSRDLLETTRKVLINEVQDKEVKMMKSLSKDMQKVLKGYQNIVKAGDKTLADKQYNYEYETILKARDTIIQMIGRLETKLITQKKMRGEEVELEEKLEPIVEARIANYKPTKFEGKEFDRKKELKALKTMHNAIIKIAKSQDNMQYTAETGGTPRIGNPHAIHQSLRSAEQAIFDYMGGIERGHYDGVIDMDRD